MKRILIYIIPLAIIGLVAAYLMYNKPHQNIQGATADMTISASQLLDAFEADEKKANDQYLDKIVLVEGIVKTIETDAEGETQITLKTGSPLASVACSMDYLSEHEGLEAIQAGDKVRLKGICTGMLMDVIIDRAVLVNDK